MFNKFLLALFILFPLWAVPASKSGTAALLTAPKTSSFEKPSAWKSCGPLERMKARGLQTIETDSAKTVQVLNNQGKVAAEIIVEKSSREVLKANRPSELTTRAMKFLAATKDVSAQVAGKVVKRSPHFIQRFIPESAKFIVALGALAYIDVMLNYDKEPLAVERLVTGQADYLTHISFMAFIAANGWTTKFLSAFSKNPNAYRAGVVYPGLAAGMMASNIVHDIAAVPGMSQCWSGLSAGLFKDRSKIEKAETMKFCDQAYETITEEGKFWPYMASKAPAAMSLIAGTALSSSTERLACMAFQLMPESKLKAMMKGVATKFKLTPAEMVLVNAGGWLKWAKWTGILKRAPFVTVQLMLFIQYDKWLMNPIQYWWDSNFGVYDNLLASKVRVENLLTSKNSRQRMGYEIDQGKPECNFILRPKNKDCFYDLDTELNRFTDLHREWRQVTLGPVLHSHSEWAETLSRFTDPYDHTQYVYAQYVSQLGIKSPRVGEATEQDPDNDQSPNFNAFNYSYPLFGVLPKDPSLRGLSGLQRYANETVISQVETTNEVGRALEYLLKGIVRSDTPKSRVERPQKILKAWKDVADKTDEKAVKNLKPDRLIFEDPETFYLFKITLLETIAQTAGAKLADVPASAREEVSKELASLLKDLGSDDPHTIQTVLKELASFIDDSKIEWEHSSDAKQEIYFLIKSLIETPSKPIVGPTDYVSRALGYFAIGVPKYFVQDTSLVQGDNIDEVLYTFKYPKLHPEIEKHPWWRLANRSKASVTYFSEIERKEFLSIAKTLQKKDPYEIAKGLLKLNGIAYPCSAGNPRTPPPPKLRQAMELAILVRSALGNPDPALKYGEAGVALIEAGQAGKSSAELASVYIPDQPRNCRTEINPTERALVAAVFGPDTAEFKKSKAFGLIPWGPDFMAPRLLEGESNLRSFPFISDKRSMSARQFYSDPVVYMGSTYQNMPDILRRKDLVRKEVVSMGITKWWETYAQNLYFNQFEEFHNLHEKLLDRFTNLIGHELDQLDPKRKGPFVIESSRATVLPFIMDELDQYVKILQSLPTVKATSLKDIYAPNKFAFALLPQMNQAESFYSQLPGGIMDYIEELFRLVHDKKVRKLFPDDDTQSRLTRASELNRIIELKLMHFEQSFERYLTSESHKNTYSTFPNFELAVIKSVIRGLRSVTADLVSYVQVIALANKTDRYEQGQPVPVLCIRSETYRNVFGRGSSVICD